MLNKKGWAYGFNYLLNTIQIMNRQTQEFHLGAYQKKMAETLLNKGNDYATDDRLSNFKLVAQIVGITPEQVIAVMIATKAVRLGNLLSKGADPHNESLSDTNLDGSNYFALMDMLLSDKGRDELTVTPPYTYGQPGNLTNVIDNSPYMDSKGNWVNPSASR